MKTLFTLLILLIQFNISSQTFTFRSVSDSIPLQFSQVFLANDGEQGLQPFLKLTFANDSCNLKNASITIYCDSLTAIRKLLERNQYYSEKYIETSDLLLYYNKKLREMQKAMLDIIRERNKYPHKL